MATNLISSVMPLLSPGYGFRYLFLFLITGALRFVVVVVVDKGELGLEQHMIRGGPAAFLALGKLLLLLVAIVGFN